MGVWRTHEGDVDVQHPVCQEPVHEGAFWRHHVGVLFPVLRHELFGREARAVGVLRPLAAGGEACRVRGRPELVGLLEDAGFAIFRLGGVGAAEEQSVRR